MVPIKVLASLAAYLVAVSAHGGVTSYSIGSTTYQGWQPYLPAAGQVTAGRPYSSYDPILNPTAATLHCNDNGLAGPSPQSITIAPGETLVGYWPQWTHAEGPVTVYMAACAGSSCDSTNSASVKWFKIAEQGLISGTLAAGQWANGILMANLKWPAKIPTNLKSGPYLIRYETLALHQANTPQFYPECVQVIVTGSGTAFPPDDYLVSIPGAWGANDPGVKVDIYSEAAKTITTYQIPGPRIWPGFTGIDIPGSDNPPPLSSSAAPSSFPRPSSSSSSRSLSSSSSRPPTTTSSAPTSVQTAWGQCGGNGWTGPTVIKELKWKPKGKSPIASSWNITNHLMAIGIILSGSPYSVYDQDAPHVDPDVFDLGVPILGICYGLQEIAWNLGGSVAKCDHREYGFAEVQVLDAPASNSLANKLFQGFEGHFQVWMSHGDQLSAIPPEFHIIGKTQTAPFAGIAHDSKPIFGIQFHPEVTHTPRGKEVISRFVIDICQCRTNWTMESFIGKEIERIRNICGPKGRVIGAVSGGVDSSVAAKLMHEAIGDRFQAIMVDNGVLRYNEANQVHEMLNQHLGVSLKVVDASDLFLSRLEGVEDPERKRKIIGNTFIEVFEAEAAKYEAEAERELAEGGEAKGKYEWLLQGTLYPDVIESISFKGPSATIKTHHNVGGLLEDMKLKLIEPLRELFKDEVRALGRLLGIPNHLVQRHPFPGPGLAIRILGPVTREQVRIAQAADVIYIEEIRKANLYDKISQAFAVLLPVHAVGVMGDKRTYEQVIALRAVQTEDFMTADWFVFPPEVLRRISSRITNEVQGVNRVVYDISSKPPGTVEWL
ncbi:GMP synthase (glutamine-hydrolyzing) [Tulasnella sp. 403]|nr:GMP synthase (glutamine-hydrolyzing) [Tulasnella sp. 403]